jgi:uncharacterized membrane protein
MVSDTDKLVRLMSYMVASAAAVVVLCIAYTDTVRTVCLLLVAELFFAVYYLVAKRQLINHRPQRHAPKQDDADRTVTHLLASVKATVQDFNTFVLEWCLGTPLKEVGRENALELVSYAVWYNTW